MNKKVIELIHKTSSLKTTPENSAFAECLKDVNWEHENDDGYKGYYIITTKYLEDIKK